MAISIPRAGTVAGRAPQIATPDPDGWAVTAEFGKRMLEHGLRWKAEQQDRAVRKANLAMTRDLGMARVEAEQIGDPAEIGRFWDQRSAEIRGKYITPDTAPEVASALDLAFTELGDRHAVELAGRMAGLKRSQTEADWIAASHDIVLDATAADPTTLAALRASGTASIDDMVARGVITPDEGARRKLALDGEIYTNRAREAIQTDPAAFLEAAEAGEYDMLGGTALTGFRLSAQNEIASAAKVGATAAEAAAKARETAIGKELDTIISLAGDGLIGEYEARLADPEVQVNPKWGEAMAAVQLRKEMPGIHQMTLAELDAAIAAEAKRPMRAAWEADRIRILKARRAEAAAAWAADPVAAGIADKLPVPDLPGFDPADPRAFAAGLSARIDFDAFAREKGYSRSAAIFSKPEKAALAAVLAPEADPAARLALAEAIVAGSDGRPGAVLDSLGADAVFRRGVALMTGPGADPVLAGEILRGQQKIALKTVTLPPEPAMITVFDRVTDGAFGEDSPLAAELLDTARALYAEHSAGVKAEGEDSIVPFMSDTKAKDLFGRMVLRATGAQSDRNGRLTIGGLQEVNGGQVMLPPGVARDDVEQMFDNLDQQTRGRIWDPAYGGGMGGWARPDAGAPDPDPLRAFRAASYSGAAPDLGANPAACLDTLTLRQIVGDPDVYGLNCDIGGRNYMVAEADGTEYRFRLSDLMRAAGR